MGGPPRLVLSLGGAQARVGPQYGVTYDHFATDLEWADGRHVLSMARQQDNCYSRVADNFQGTNGSANVEGGILTPTKGDKFKFPEKLKVNPYVQEHADLLKSIRDGKPLNEAKQITDSVLTAVAARISAYTGQLIRLSDVAKSKHSLMPEKLAFGPLPESVMPIPGQTKGLL